jgi:Rod binding domain-containing protein
MDSLQLPIGIDTANLRAMSAVQGLRSMNAMRGVSAPGAHQGMRVTDAKPGSGTAAAEEVGDVAMADTAKKFQSVFSTLLVKEMRRSLGDGFFGEGAGGDIYSGWLDEHVGQTLADRDALHMRDLIERSLFNKAAEAEVIS